MLRRTGPTPSFRFGSLSLFVGKVVPLFGNVTHGTNPNRLLDTAVVLEYHHTGSANAIEFGALLFGIVLTLEFELVTGKASFFGFIVLCCYNGSMMVFGFFFFGPTVLAESLGILWILPLFGRKIGSLFDIATTGTQAVNYSTSSSVVVRSDGFGSRRLSIVGVLSELDAVLTFPKELFPLFARIKSSFFGRVTSQAASLCGEGTIGLGRLVGDLLIVTILLVLLRQFLQVGALLGSLGCAAVLAVPATIGFVPLFLPVTRPWTISLTEFAFAGVWIAGSVASTCTCSTCSIFSVGFLHMVCFTSTSSERRR